MKDFKYVPSWGQKPNYLREKFKQLRKGQEAAKKVEEIRVVQLRKRNSK